MKTAKDIILRALSYDGLGEDEKGSQEEAKRGQKTECFLEKKRIQIEAQLLG